MEFVTISPPVYVLVFWPQNTWDPSSPTGDRTLTPCIGRGGLSHWTTREAPLCESLILIRTPVIRN